MTLTFEEVRATNGQRCEKWHRGSTPWVGSDWSSAMAGEAGEACNFVKKLRRIETGVPGRADPDRATLVAKLALELADTFLYLDLVAQFYDIDLPGAIVEKFNAISEREGFAERL